MFGKAKQTSKSITINDQKVSTSISEKMDYLVPAAKIADMATGWLAGQAARDFTPTDMKSLDGINIEESEEFKTTKYFCKTNFDMDENQAGGILLRRSPQDIFLRLGEGEGNHAQPQFQKSQ